MTLHHSSRRAREQKKDINRQQARRDSLKASGTPTTHVLDRAIVEGLMFQIELKRLRGEDVSTMEVSVQYVLSYATAILTAHTNGTNQYKVDPVVRSIRKRIGQPKFGKFRIENLTKEQRNADALRAIEYAYELDS